jgi:hypothetical protein
MKPMKKEKVEMEQGIVEFPPKVKIVKQQVGNSHVTVTFPFEEKVFTDGVVVELETLFSQCLFFENSSQVSSSRDFPFHVKNEKSNVEKILFL